MKMQLITCTLLTMVGCAKNIGSLTNREELPQHQAAQACRVTAEELEESGHVKEAIHLYEKARRLDSSQLGLSRRLAVLYDVNQQEELAIAEFQKALKESPDDAELLNDFGYFHSQRERWQEAERWLTKAAQADPDNKRVWVNLGVALARQKKYESGLDAFSKGVGEAAAHSNVGVIMAQHGHADARTYLAKARQLDPSLKQPDVFLAHVEATTATNDKLVTNSR